VLKRERLLLLGRKAKYFISLIFFSFLQKFGSLNWPVKVDEGHHVKVAQTPEEKLHASIRESFGVNSRKCSEH
jgi:hypothetical protein